MVEKISLYTQNMICTTDVHRARTWILGSPHSALPSITNTGYLYIVGKRAPSRPWLWQTVVPFKLSHQVNSYSGEIIRKLPTNIRLLWNIVLCLKLHVTFAYCSVTYPCLMQKGFQWLRIKGCSRKLHHATLCFICSSHIEKHGGKSFKRLKIFLCRMYSVFMPNVFLQIIQSTLGQAQIPRFALQWS